MSTASDRRCPACGEAGTTVKPITLDSLLGDEAKERLHETPYRFCSTPTCGTVYFPEDGSDTFGKPDLEVRVGIKETEEKPTRLVRLEKAHPGQYA